MLRGLRALHLHYICTASELWGVLLLRHCNSTPQCYVRPSYRVSSADVGDTVLQDPRVITSVHMDTICWMSSESSPFLIRLCDHYCIWHYECTTVRPVHVSMPQTCREVTYNAWTLLHVGSGSSSHCLLHCFMSALEHPVTAPSMRRH